MPLAVYFRQNVRIVFGKHGMRQTGGYAVLLGASGMIGSLAHPVLEACGYRTIAPMRSASAERRFRGWLRARGYESKLAPHVLPFDEDLVGHVQGIAGDAPVACIVNAIGPISLARSSPRQSVHVRLARDAVELARRLRPRRLVHVSTAFVPALGSRLDGWRPSNDYERYKQAADRLIADAELPDTAKVVFRPAVACHDPGFTAAIHKSGVYRFWFDLRNGTRPANGAPVTVRMTTPYEVPIELVNESAMSRALARCLAVNGAALREVTLVERSALPVGRLTAMMSETDPSIRFHWAGGAPRLNDTMRPVRHFYPYISRVLDPAYHTGSEVLLDEADKTYLIEHFRSITESIRERDRSATG